MRGFLVFFVIHLLNLASAKSKNCTNVGFHRANNDRESFWDLWRKHMVNSGCAPHAKRCYRSCYLAANGKHSIGAWCYTARYGQGGSLKAKACKLNSDCYRNQPCAGTCDWDTQSLQPYPFTYKYGCGKKVHKDGKRKCWHSCEGTKGTYGLWCYIGEYEGPIKFRRSSTRAGSGPDKRFNCETDFDCIGHFNHPCAEPDRYCDGKNYYAVP